MMGLLMLRRSTRRPPEAQLAARELVADEQLVGDPLHLFSVEEDQITPSFLKVQETGSLRVHLRVEMIELRPVGV